MAERKIFAGPRVRRIRNGLGLTQTAMAEALEISPSYLNLIERNQRPLTVQLLLKLASVYKVDLDDLQGESAGSAGQLREVKVKPVTVKSDLIAEAIIAAAKRNKVDLIVMASHGRKGIKRLLLGSETQQVLTHSHIPVLVLR